MVMWHAGNGWHHDTRWVGAAVGVEEGPVWSQCAVTFPLPLPLGHIVEQGAPVLTHIVLGCRCGSCLQYGLVGGGWRAPHDGV